MAKMELKLVSKEAYEFYKTSIEAVIAERRDEPAVCIVSEHILSFQITKCLK